VTQHQILSTFIAKSSLHTFSSFYLRSSKAAPIKSSIIMLKEVLESQVGSLLQKIVKSKSHLVNSDPTSNFKQFHYTILASYFFFLLPANKRQKKYAKRRKTPLIVH
jgi:hypothetical protein